MEAARENLEAQCATLSAIRSELTAAIVPRSPYVAKSKQNLMTAALVNIMLSFVACAAVTSTKMFGNMYCAKWTSSSSWTQKLSSSQFGQSRQQRCFMTPVWFEHRLKSSVVSDHEEKFAVHLN
eukprot:2703283-Amphidinium_carterae.1